MPRCPACHRRLRAAARCPRDGQSPPAFVDAAPDPQAPDIEGYRVTGLLGVGGFGSVWEAVVTGDPASLSAAVAPRGSAQPARSASPVAAPGIKVALKVGHNPDVASILRLGREADALKRVGPPHVPALVASGTLADGRAYLAMERLEGRTLGDEIADWAEPPALPVVRAVGTALLSSAAALHMQGVFHRDLKPENVFLIGDGKELRAKLMDFGLALPVSRAAQSQTLTDGGAGTPEYMSPEQIGGQDGDLRSDVYGLGVMLFELTTLRLPFTGERREIEYAHLSFRPPRPSRLAPVPPALEELILRCLSKNPAHRPSDAFALRSAFARAVGQAGDRTDSTETGTGTSSHTGTGAARAGTTLRGSERQKVALVFVGGDAISAIDIQAAVLPFGGQLAHLAPGQCVCAFTHRAGDHPGERALAAAEALLAKGLATRLIVDVGTVAVKPRPDGPARLLSPLFTQSARYPGAGDPRGVLISAAARQMLPGIACEPAPGRPECFVLRPLAEEERTRTAMQDGVGPLFGRDAELRALLDEAERAVTERRPRVATVLGEQGLGKSRLAFELAHLLRSRAGTSGADVIELAAREPGGNDADEVLAELLRRTLELPGGRPPENGRELLAERLGKEAALAAALLLGWVADDDPAVISLRAAPGALRANVARAGMEALLRRAAQRPVLVMLDDAHWADHALLDALEQATVSELPLWVCALGRPAFAESRPTWGRRAAGAHRLRLEPLDPASAAALCRHLLAPAIHVPEPVVARLVERTQAVPLLVCDLIRGLRREGLVRKKDESEHWYIATEVLDRLPDTPSLEWLVGRELDELPAELAAHARLLAMLSSELTGEEVEGVLAAMDLDLADAFPLDAAIGTDRLRQAQVLVRHRTGRFAFRTEVMRDAVARMVGEPLAVRIHRAALAYYRAAPLPDSTRLPRLAWHAAQAGERDEAASTYLTLAEAARERHNYLEADLSYTRALGQLRDEDEGRRLRALKGRGIVRYRLARYTGSLEDLAQAHELALRGGDPLTVVDVMLDESMALDWTFGWRRSRDLAERARELLAGLPVTPALEARVLLAIGRGFHRFNQDHEAAPVLREAVRVGELAGDEGYEVQVTAGMLLGFLLPFIGQLDEAADRLQVAIARCQAKGDEMHLAASRNNRSCLWIARNDRPRFMADTELVLAYARRMGNANLERHVHMNTAYFLYWRAEYDEALPYVNRTIEIDQDLSWQGGARPDGAVLKARILWGRGDDEQAREVVAAIRQHQEAARAAGEQELLLAPNDALLFELAELLLANGTAGAWELLVTRAREVAQGQELIEILEAAGIAAERRGDRDAARRWWGEALEVGQRIANVMSDRIRSRLAAA
jgi:serine/threonine protein kinase/tetratricopeptide (TPR) repeat protein